MERLRRGRTERWWEYLKSLRLKAGLTIRAVARQTQRLATTREQALTDSYLSQLERGRARNPSVHKLVMLAMIYRWPFPLMIADLVAAGFSTSEARRLPGALQVLDASKRIYSTETRSVPLETLGRVLSSDEAARQEIVQLLDDQTFFGLVSLLAKAYAGPARERREAEKRLVSEIMSIQPAPLKGAPPTKALRRAGIKKIVHVHIDTSKARGRKRTP